MTPEFQQLERDAAKSLIALALKEDLDEAGDLTCRALIDESSCATVNVVARQRGVLCGSPVARLVFAQLDAGVRWNSDISDGNVLKPGDVVATLMGPVRSLLTGERTALNFLTHLSGVATLTGEFVAAVAGINVEILDTRKTTPGFRALEKYAVRCGGGMNHRMGLFDGILIKDNHLAARAASPEHANIENAISRARKFPCENGRSVEVEVDTLDQLTEALAAKPDIVLLDNMSTDLLRQAVALRSEIAPDVRLEASGGVNLQTVRAIAETGIDRISIGALTHSAVALDLAFDWPER